MNIFDIGVTKAVTEYYAGMALHTFTAPARVTNEEIAIYLHYYAPMLELATMKSGNADTTIKNMFGDYNTIRFSRIIKDE